MAAMAVTHGRTHMAAMAVTHGRTHMAAMAVTHGRTDMDANMVARMFALAVKFESRLLCAAVFGPAVWPGICVCS